MSTLRKRFIKGAKVPVGEKLSSDQEGFYEVLNEVFGFHDSEVISSNLNLMKGTLELVVNYIAEWKTVGKLFNLKWRKLMIRCEGIENITFGGRDTGFGMSVFATYSVNIGYPIKVKEHEKLRKMRERFVTDITGSVLNAIEARQLGSIPGHTSVRLDFDWLVSKEAKSLEYESIDCKKVSLKFVSKAKSEKW